jgi:signal transduction histidine kinase
MRGMTDRPVTRPSAGDRALATAELVLEIVTAASGEAELDQILHAALDRLGALVPLTGGSIATIEGDELVIRAAVGPFAGEALGQRLRRGPGRSWHAVETGEPILVRDVQAEGARPAGRQAAVSMRSWLAVPIARAGRSIGLLEIDSTRPRAFTEEDVTLVTTIVRALAGPIELAARYAAERRAGLLRDAFVGVISHELRTPITAVYGLSKMLRRRFDSLDPRERMEAIADIEAEADRLQRLAEDLLVLSRAESGRVEMAREPILVGHIARRATEAEAQRWPARRFVIESPTGLPTVLGEDTYVEQVIRNLLTNAAKYSPAGSTIRVVVDAPDGTVRLRILDDGIGIAAEHPERLFDLFYRSSEAARTASGAGIGLFVCRQLVEAMNGRIWAAARPDGGAEFGFELPIATVSDLDDDFLDEDDEIGEGGEGTEGPNDRPARAQTRAPRQGSSARDRRPADDPTQGIRG